MNSFLRLSFHSSTLADKRPIIFYIDLFRMSAKTIYYVNWLKKKTGEPRASCQILALSDKRFGKVL